jgi:hypothetical protein
MSPDDTSDFVDGDLEASKNPFSASSAAASPLQRAPSREEVDEDLAAARQKLADLKRQQEALERERASLEETRRRQMELQTGRQELIESLTRGIGLLQEAEFNARRDAEQMAKTLEGLRSGLDKVEAIHEDTWSKENFSVELTRGRTTVENARMEWNTARLKFPVLSTPPQDPAQAAATQPGKPTNLFDVYSFGDLCRIGFAFTWPLAVVAVLALGVLLFFLLRQ